MDRLKFSAEWALNRSAESELEYSVCLPVVGLFS